MQVISAIFILSLLSSALAFPSSPEVSEKIDVLVQEFERKFQIPSMSPQELKIWLKRPHSRLILIDVRSQPEREVSHIPGSITPAQFSAFTGSNSQQETRIVTFCTIGLRSSQYAQEILEDFPELKDQVFNLRGGILGWINSGGNLVDSNGKETVNIHVYGEKWNAVPQGYRASWFGFWERLWHEW